MCKFIGQKSESKTGPTHFAWTDKTPGIWVIGKAHKVLLRKKM